MTWRCEKWVIVFPSDRNCIQAAQTLFPDNRDCVLRQSEMCPRVTELVLLEARLCSRTMDVVLQGNWNRIPIGCNENLTCCVQFDIVKHVWLVQMAMKHNKARHQQKTCLISKTFDNVMFDVHMHSQKNIDGEWKSHGKWLRNRRSHILFRGKLNPALQRNQDGSQKTCFVCRCMTWHVGCKLPSYNSQKLPPSIDRGGVPPAPQHPSSNKTTIFGYGQITTPTPSENWEQSYELLL